MFKTVSAANYSAKCKIIPGVNIIIFLLKPIRASSSKYMNSNCWEYV